MNDKVKFQHKLGQRVKYNDTFDKEIAGDTGTIISQATHGHRGPYGSTIITNILAQVKFDKSNREVWVDEFRLEPIEGFNMKPNTKKP